jgi:uncharacterized membrane protein (UPF0136 family)
MNANTVLWVYIVLLFAGGLMGFLKAKSKASLIMSSIFAALLALCASNSIFKREVGNAIADGILAFLFIFFAMKLAKSKKFMPSGMMLVLTLVCLVLRHI